MFPLYSEESTQSALHSCLFSLNTGCFLEKTQLYYVHRKQPGQTKEVELFLGVIVFCICMDSLDQL